MPADDDEVRGFYDAYGERLGLAGEYDHLEPVLPDLSGATVLDAGCGLGDGSRYLAEQGATVTGIDVSGDEIAAARRAHGDVATFHRLDLREPLDRFDDGAFDVVVCALTLAHIEEWEAPFASFHRVLADDGVVVLHAHHPFVDYLELDADAEQASGHTAAYGDVERFTRPWGPAGEAMPFFRRPLGEFFRPALDAGFALEAFVEPGAGPHSTDRYGEASPPRHLLLRYRRQ